MKKQTIFFAISLMLLFTAFSSCKKEGTGGKSSISGRVMHHEAAIPGATIYIKYGAIDFPGSNATSYDASVISNAQGDYKFEGLQKGDYYLYGMGYDTSGELRGGIAVKIRRNEDKEINVPITE
jgi:hypothetical protein